MSAPTTKKSVYKIASIPADGIGPEVIDAGITVLKKLTATLQTFNLEFQHFDWNSNYYKEHGHYIPEGGLDKLKTCDAILFGAVGAPGERWMAYAILLPNIFYMMKPD